MKNETIVLNKKRLSDKIRLIRRCAIKEQIVKLFYLEQEKEIVIDNLKTEIEELKRINYLLNSFIDENKLRDIFFEFLYDKMNKDKSDMLRKDNRLN